MIYRMAVLSTVLMASIGFAIPAHAEAWTLKGTCSKGNIAKSDGVQTGAANGMRGKDDLALMQRATAAHLTLGSDGFLWATQPVQCDSAIVWVKANSKGDTLVSFSNGDPSKPVLGFAGVPVDDNGSLFFSDSVYLGDGKPAMKLNPNSNVQSCHFYFTDHGTFSQGWENRLSAIECNARATGADGRLISVDVRFDTAQASGPATPSDEIYRPHPGEAYAPAVYCGSNRTGLPPEQQKICLERDTKNPPELYKAKPGETLEKLVPNCQIGGAETCNDDFFQPVWKRIEADNGEVTRIDMNSIQHLADGTTDVTVYTGAPHTMFDSTRLKMLWFDCQGHFRAFDGSFGQSEELDTPPRSIAGEIANVVCINRGAPDSAEYCAGFSPDACNRIKKVVETNVTPTYCKPGFGLVGSGLTLEQLRICYVMPPLVGEK